MMGPGWATPYNLIVVAHNRPITTPALLASIDTFETQIAKNKTVDSVTGPGAINSTSNQLQDVRPGARSTRPRSPEQSKKDLLKLINGLGQAGAGSASCSPGSQQAVVRRRPAPRRLRPGPGRAPGSFTTGSPRPAPAGQLAAGLNSGAGRQANSAPSAQDRRRPGAGRRHPARSPGSSTGRAAGQPGLPAISALATTASRSTRRSRPLRRAAPVDAEHADRRGSSALGVDDQPASRDSRLRLRRSPR